MSIFSILTHVLLHSNAFILKCGDCVLIVPKREHAIVLIFWFGSIDFVHYFFFFAYCFELVIELVGLDRGKSRPLALKIGAKEQNLVLAALNGCKLLAL